MFSDSLWQGFPSTSMRDGGIELLLGIQQKLAMLKDRICNAVHCICPCSSGVLTGQFHLITTVFIVTLIAAASSEEHMAMWCPQKKAHCFLMKSLPGSCWFSELHDLECLCSNLLQRRDFLFYWCLCSELTFHSPLNISLWEPFQVF